MSRMHRLITLGALVSVAAPVGARLGAQSLVRPIAPDSAVAVPVQIPAPLAPAPVAVRAHAPSSALFAAPAPSPTPRSTSLMIVGGAALIVGAVVGGRSGTIIMVGGGVIGLVGLWKYLQ